MSRSFRIALRALGIGALVAGGLVVALIALLVVILIGPLIFWLAWNVLDFAAAVGLPELGFWGIVLATLFLVIGWLGKVAMWAVELAARGAMVPILRQRRRRTGSSRGEHASYAVRWWPAGSSSRSLHCSWCS